MEWHGGAKIFDGVMTKKGKEGKKMKMKGDTGSDGSGAAVPHCYDLASEAVLRMDAPSLFAVGFNRVVKFEL